MPIILTESLTDALNTTRKKKGLSTIENALIVRKLGILFAFKSEKQINFKAKRIELDETQQVILLELIDQYFNVDMTNYLQPITIEQENSLTPHIPASQSEKKGLFNKVKGFFANKT